MRVVICPYQDCKEHLEDDEIIVAHFTFVHNFKETKVVDGKTYATTIDDIRCRLDMVGGWYEYELPEDRKDESD